MGVLECLCVLPILLSVPLFLSFHEVQEGHVGVYWRGGRLLNVTAEPGYHFKLPLVTQHEDVQVTLQTDKVRDIPCGTSGGTTVVFEMIEVVNQLQKDHVLNTVRNFGTDYDQMWIFKKVHHVVNEFCSSYTLKEVYIDLFDSLDERLVESLQVDCDRYDTGVLIESIRVTKPRIPRATVENFEQLEVARTSNLVAAANQLVQRRQEELESARATIRAETESLVSQIAAEKSANISRLSNEMWMIEKEAELEMETINHAIYVEREKVFSDASLYRLSREAEAREGLYTPNFLLSRFYTSVGDKGISYYGERVSDLVNDLVDAGESVVRSASTDATSQSK